LPALEVIDNPQASLTLRTLGEMRIQKSILFDGLAGVVGNIERFVLRLGTLAFFATTSHGK
jgi:hypothetical protein